MNQRCDRSVPRRAEKREMEVLRWDTPHYSHISQPTRCTDAFACKKLRRERRSRQASYSNTPLPRETPARLSHRKLDLRGKANRHRPDRARQIPSRISLGFQAAWPAGRDLWPTGLFQPRMPSAALCGVARNFRQLCTNNLPYAIARKLGHDPQTVRSFENGESARGEMLSYRFEGQGCAAP